MTLNCTDASPGGTVTGLPVRELEQRVLAEAGRPCKARPEDWFPDESAARSTRARAAFQVRARALCQACPVVAECLELTIQREGPRRGYGIAGGTASWERQALKRARGWPVPGGKREAV